MRSAGHRIYADFLLPSRLGEFRQLLEQFLAGDRSIVSVETFWELAKTDRLLHAQRYVVLRHDIDTDPGTARAMWEIERDLGVCGSFFFRLSTADIPLMRSIAASGGGVGYHYEEIATIAKERRLRTGSDLEEHLVEATEAFVRNLSRLRVMTGLPMTVVASHGDFVNRLLGVPNTVLLADPELRRRASVELEVYDQAVMKHTSSRHSDTGHPVYWVPESPRAAIARDEHVIYLLVHPRHWRAARVVNARDDLVRLAESIRYALPTSHRAR